MATPINNPFKASLLTDSCSSLELSCDCKKITFKDTSNYSTNDLPNHGSELFTSRVITITKPDGTFFYYITADVKLNNPTIYPDSQLNVTYKIIQPQATSNNTFTYNFIPTDSDGIYEVELCTYPNWAFDGYYEAFLKPIVLREGKLYKAIVSNTNIDPITDVNHVYWEEYEKTSTCSDTRYCTSQRIVVLCISIMDCYRQAVSDAFCGIQNHPCRDMCDNKAFMKAMKMRVVMDGLDFASCAHDWVNAEKHVDILKSLCCCGQ